MDIFISWSGERSRKIAVFLEEWLKTIIQSTNPWISTKHIDNGSIWFNEISTSLSNCRAGIICLTPENKNEPWILFEAGSLSKGIKENRIYTLLIDLKPVDVRDPLSQFNHTNLTKEGMYSLLVSINNAMEAGQLEERILSKSFEKNWDDFENEIKKIVIEKPNGIELSKTSDSEMIEEILLNTRSLHQRVTELELNMTPILFDEKSTPKIESIHPDFLKMKIQSLRDKKFDDAYIYMRLRQEGYPQAMLVEFMRQFNARYPRDKD